MLNIVRKTLPFWIGILFLSCAGTPQDSAPVPASVSTIPMPTTNELDAAIRETSNYLNQQLPKGNKLVILNIQSEFPALSEYIIDELIANTVNDRVFSAVDRQQLDTIRAELNFQMSGEVDDHTAQELGRMAGAQIIISGAVSKIGDLYRIRVRALNVQTASIAGQFNRNIPDSPMVQALVRSRATGYSNVSSAAGSPRPGTTTTSTQPALSAGSPAQSSSGGATSSTKLGTVYNGNGHSYEVVNMTMSWTDAKRYCEERGGCLATITSPGEQAFIENLLAREGSKSVYWLGGYCSNDRKFQWLTGERFEYTNWMPLQPDNDGNIEDKIEITRIAAPYTSNSRPGQWNDAPTNNNTMRKDSYDYYSTDLGFICEFE